MRPFTATILIGLAFSVGMLVPLVGLHWTENFRRLEPLGAILWGDERVATDPARASDEIPKRAVSTNSVPDHRGTSGAGPPASSKTALHKSRDIDGDTTVGTATAGGTFPDKRNTVLENRSRIDPSLPGVEVATILIATDPAANARRTVSLTISDIADIQTFLKIHGFDPGPIDGVIGSRSESAIRAFERSQEMPLSGKATPNLLVLFTGAADSKLTDKDNVASATASTTDVAVLPEPEVRAGAPLRLIP
jgi:hypothetical protein